MSLGLSGPRSRLIGGHGDDTFAHEVTVSDYAYDLNPLPLTRRVDLVCGPGADTVEPYPKFRHGRGCPARAPRLAARPLTLRGRCKDRCHWRGSRRIVVTVRNPTRRRVRFHSARLLIEQFYSEPSDRLFRTLARRRYLIVPARGSAQIVMPARKRRALDRELNEYIPFGVVPALEVTGTLVDRDGDRTTGNVVVRIREKPIEGYRPI